MKRMRSIRIFTIVIGVLLFYSTMSYGFQDAEFKVAVTGNGVKIHLEPSPTSKVIGEVQDGAVLIVESQTGDWYRIRLPLENRGIVLSGYIPKVFVTAVSEMKQPEQVRTLTVTNDNAPLYDRASWDGDIVGGVSVGLQLISPKKQEDWYAVYLSENKEGPLGYIHQTFVSVNGVEPTMRREPPRPAAPIEKTNPSREMSPRPAVGDQSQKSLKIFAGAVITYGGDILAKSYNPSSGEVQETLKAGQLFELKGGISFSAGPGLSLRGSIGYHGGFLSADNGTITFSRFPLEGLCFWRATDKLKVGAGARISLGPTISGQNRSGVEVGSVKLESSPGIVFEAEYRLWSSGGLCLRYVNEKYQFSSGEKVDAGYFGFGCSFYF